MRKKSTTTYLGYLFLVCAFNSVQGWCGIATGRELASFENLNAVENQVLDDMRGGYLLPDGMKIDIGIGRATFINDTLQLQNSVALNNININGHSISVADVENINSAIKTVIQNSLDNKTIQHFTVLDVNVKNLGGFVESMRSVQNINATQYMQITR